MCGILCIFKLPGSKKQNILDPLNPKLEQLLRNRGPDKFEKIVLHEDEILFAGSVLWHQGKSLASQPLKIGNGILVFNGDIYNMESHVIISDTVWLLLELNKCENEDDFLTTFRNIEGPYSFIYYNINKKILYFGRDSFGRNSFIIENDEDVIKLSSVSQILPLSSTRKTIELPSVGIFKINMNAKHDLTLYPWKEIKDEKLNAAYEVGNLLQTNLVISKLINPEWLNVIDEPHENYDFYDIVNNLKEETNNIFEILLENQIISLKVNKLLHLLEESVKKRIQKTQKYCSNCLQKTIKNNNDDDDNDNSQKILACNHGKIGILFSGGIDCTILAAISHKFIDSCEPIDLINVAFEKVQKSTNCKEQNKEIDWNVPDRLTANKSLNELQKLFPERTWNLVEINVSRLELHEKLKNDICNLIYPLKTVLDESLGCAFWFASRGVGTVNGVHYESKCRVILVGSGADELFGGYTRHRNTYRRCNSSQDGKLKSLKNELDLDWDRISVRNLARDDRVIGDHGRTVRVPFIDEELVKFVRNFQPSQICCFTLNEGIGDKLLLRLCGYKIGLKMCATYKKRAIQFGSRIANKTQNASDNSEFL